eukprot:TRINITY_DN6433_c0_g1_i15.p1 TRINITY_DN6433_c0_g1~~TRINITY_DN6433_c0_g1_i15.p1  ORF type:complete len:552 (-),score=91.81 TRINITY_DN6433_c0_g1_i15:2920-4575(-)
MIQIKAEDGQDSILLGKEHKEIIERMVERQNSFRKIQATTRNHVEYNLGDVVQKIEAPEVEETQLCRANDKASEVLRSSLDHRINLFEFIVGENEILQMRMVGKGRFKMKVNSIHIQAYGDVDNLDERKLFFRETFTTEEYYTYLGGEFFAQEYDKKTDGELSYLKKMLEQEVKVGVNMEYALKNNEILLVISKKTPHLGRFIKLGNIAALVIPHSQLRDFNIPSSSQSHWLRKESSNTVPPNSMQTNKFDQNRALQRRAMMELLNNFCPSSTATVGAIEGVGGLSIEDERQKLDNEIQAMQIDFYENMDRMKKELKDANEKLSMLRETKSELTKNLQIKENRVKEVRLKNLKFAENLKKFNEEKLKSLYSILERNLSELDIRKKDAESQASSLKEKKVKVKEDLAKEESRYQTLHAQDHALQVEANRLKDLKLKLKRQSDLLMAQNVTQNPEERLSYLCVVCRDKPRDVIYFPCKHFVECFSCSVKNSQVGKKCLVCPEIVEETESIRLSNTKSQSRKMQADFLSQHLILAESIQIQAIFVDSLRIFVLC